MGFPVLAWGAAENFFEDLAEVGGVGEAGLESNVQDGCVSGAQQAAGRLHTIVLKIVVGGFVDTVLEAAEALPLTNGGGGGDVFQ